MNSKYDECIQILKEIKEMAMLVIEAGVGDQMTAMEIIEETLMALKAIEQDKSVRRTHDVSKPVKGKGYVH
jgi:hypothetical protein